MKIRNTVKQWLQAKAALSDGRKTEVQVDYPKEGEVVAHPTYSIRIGAVPEAIHVEVSIDGGAWSACRESLGLWWFDWADYAPGPHAVKARILKERNQISESAERRFMVRFAEAPPSPPPGARPG